MLEDKLVGQPSNSWYISFCYTCLLTTFQKLRHWNNNYLIRTWTWDWTTNLAQSSALTTNTRTSSVSEARRRDLTSVQLSALTTESSQHYKTSWLVSQVTAVTLLFVVPYIHFKNFECLIGTWTRDWTINLVQSSALTTESSQRQNASLVRSNPWYILLCVVPSFVHWIGLSHC